jgi:hypothetical protein
MRLTSQAAFYFGLSQLVPFNYSKSYAILWYAKEVIPYPAARDVQSL